MGVGHTPRISGHWAPYLLLQYRPAAYGAYIEAPMARDHLGPTRETMGAPSKQVKLMMLRATACQLWPSETNRLGAHEKSAALAALDV